MFSKQNLILGYLRIKNWITSWVNYLYTRIFHITSIVGAEGSRTNYYVRYVLIKILYMCYVGKNWLKYIDIKVNQLRVETCINNNRKTFLLNGFSVGIVDAITYIETNRDVLAKVPSFTNKYLITKCELKKNALCKEKPFCLLSLIQTYRTENNAAGHTFRNIFKFNNVEYSDDSVINIKMFKMPKGGRDIILPINDMLDRNINEICNLDA